MEWERGSVGRECREREVETQGRRRREKVSEYGPKSK